MDQPMMPPSPTYSNNEFPQQEYNTPEYFTDGFEPYMQNDVNEYITDNIPSGIYPPNQYASLGRNVHVINNSLGYTYQPPPPMVLHHSNPPSVISSHRSTTAAPSYAPHHHILGRATPSSQILSRYNMSAPPSHISSNYHPASSQSSLDQASSLYVDQFDNNSKLSQPSTRLSQASRSSEMFQRPLTARMATHV